MIKKEELIAVGKILKTHGVKGELVVQLNVLEIDTEVIPYIVCDIDGIFVPFFIDSVRIKTNNTVIVKLDTIDTEIQAKKLNGLPVYLSKELMAQYRTDTSIPLLWNELLGYTVEDKHLGVLGEITAIDDSTINILFNIQDESGKELLMPANEDLIIDVNNEERVILVSLPEGLTEI